MQFLFLPMFMSSHICLSDQGGLLHHPWDHAPLILIVNEISEILRNVLVIIIIIQSWGHWEPVFLAVHRQLNR